MKFEHLIEINDLTNPLVTRMTREQLWNGLVLRAEFPKLFISYLDSCSITSRDLDSLTRTLRFGELTIHDQVQFSFLNHVHYEVHAQGDIPRSSLHMQIEEPVPEALFIRFKYDDGHKENSGGAEDEYSQYRRAAYLEADIDMVRILREMLEVGRLNHLLT